MRIRALRAPLALLALACWASPAAADRPSLIELQATLDQVLAGLCDGDPASCGPPATPAVGTLVFSPGGPNEVAVPLVDLVLSIDLPITCTISCAYAGAATFPPVLVTVEQSAQSALLLSQLSSGVGLDANVTLVVDGAPLEIVLDLAVVSSLTPTEVPGRTRLALSYREVTLLWQGLSASWNLQSQTGSGCNVPPEERHVELAGNDPAALDVGEIEAVHSVTAASSQAASRPAVSFTRRPPHPCFLRSTAAHQVLTLLTFERLWGQDDAFPGRQAVETVAPTQSLIDRWELRLASGAVSERVDLIAVDGSIVTRSFDAGGNLAGEESWDF